MRKLITVEQLLSYFPDDSDMNIEVCSTSDEWSEYDSIRACSPFWKFIKDWYIEEIGVVNGVIRISILEGDK